MERHIGGPEEMNRFAADFLETIGKESGAAIIALAGELGAGKTTFTQAAACALGVSETVNSPTFVIEKIYALKNQKWSRLVHIDAYRLRTAHELRDLGWNEIVKDPANLIIIEWPEHVEDAIPQSAHRISISIGDGERRKIIYGKENEQS